MTQSVKLRHESTRLTVTIVANTAYGEPPVDAREFAAASVAVPSAWTPAALGLAVSPTLDGTYLPLLMPVMHSSAVYLAQVASVTASQAYVLPPIESVGFMRLWSCDAVGADVNQAAVRELLVLLKG